MSQYSRYPTIDTGTVSSVSLSAPGSILTVSGSPVTSSGTLTLGLVAQTANTVWAGPTSGGNAAPTFRALVPADIPSLNYVSSVTASAPLASSGGLTPNITITGSSLTESTSSVLTITGGSASQLAATTIQVKQATTSQSGYLSNVDWNTFNGKQASGSYITALTGDVSAAGPGSVAAIVNSINGQTAANVATAAATVNGSQSGNKFLASPSGGGAGTPAFRAVVAADIPTLNQNTTGTAANITASSNSTLTTLSSLSLPTSQLTGTIGLTTQVSGVLPAANGGSPPVTRNLWVDKNRTDTFTADGSFARPFATVTAAINQVITNADNSTHQYTIFVAPGSYAETLTFNSTFLTNIVITCWMSTAETPQNCIVTGLTSTSNNTQLATLVFNNITFNGPVNLTGDTNGTNFASSQVLFSACQFNNSASTIVLNNINNVNFYNCQIQGSGSISTFTNVAFAYIQGVEGYTSGTVLHLVQNNAGNQPSQASGNYLLLSETKMGATVTIDAGSELDAIQTYFSSASNITNNGTIHSFQSTWSGATTLNSGSSTRLRGDTINTNPTLSGGAVTTNQSTIYLGAALLGSTAAPASNTVLVTADGHEKSTQTTPPTTTTNANAGTGASSSVSNATDRAGKLNLTLGSIGTLASGVQVTVNFNKAYNVAPIVQLTATNSTTALNSSTFGVYVGSTTSGFSINFATAGVATDVLQWNYQVIETQ